MSGQAAQLLDAFEALEDDDKRSFTAAFLKRVIPFDSGDLDDSELGHAADSVMTLLDAEDKIVDNDAHPR
jgi:hypothetical protein